ncbi:cytochrome P450 [Herbihabitans rhizosphaerae]|uniref:Cytochrome P450 n=1 Tax=Herbihabitans rhizosphaerae TaxID=1872711 RepID=A0A4Q7KRU0_9PSEU|nr:cytochrome P450 [Herbihabitans rhizosphaerae]RZS39254.1 cytochrome P450 [Herbihabitans rhizosphaerae]
MTELADRPTPDFPMKRTCPFDPPPGYQELRDQPTASRVTLPTGKQSWVLTKHTEVRSMLADTRFSSDRRLPGFPLLTETSKKFMEADPGLIGMDPPDHGPARRAVVGEFTVKRMQALQPRIQEIVDTFIDEMLAGPNPADLVEALALPVPSLVICELLGVPYADHEFFQSRSAKLLNTADGIEPREKAADELEAYLTDLIMAKEPSPSEEDLLGRQIIKQREEGTYDRKALVSLAFLLLLAGHETTANMISLGTIAFLRNPEQLAAVKADPGKTLPAVEELLRYFTIAELAGSRVATEDIEIGGVLIRAGEGVIGLAHAANRDPNAFADPDSLDIDRGARHHVAFGYGPHQCLGQNLARMELQIVFDTLFRRVPTLRVEAEFDELSFKDSTIIFGVRELPVAW